MIINQNNRKLKKRVMIKNILRTKILIKIKKVF